MSRENMVGEQAHSLCVAPRGEILKGSNPNVARGHAGEDRTGKNPVADHLLACCHGGQCTGGGYAERSHRLADNVFAQDRAQRCTAIAPAREWCAA